ncbi:MAG: hypothetical protein ACOYI5_11845 [Christensenellales bacterium]|jgi:hypothetical protein
MKQKAVRMVAIILVAMLLLTMIISVVASSVRAEAGDQNVYTMDITLREDEQALLISQRLSYFNDTGDALDRVVFAVYANQFRRQSAIQYETDAALPYGYLPGGLAFTSVKVNGEAVEFGFLDENELFLRVPCELAPGEGCEIELEYAALLTQNAGFFGAGAVDWRLSGFYPLACLYQGGEWITNRPVQHARYIYAAPADYDVIITLPREYQIAATGAAEAMETADDQTTWRVTARGIREFSISAGRAWRAHTDQTPSGVAVTVYTGSRLGARRALDTALETIELYESWFGAFPVAQIAIAASDYALDRIAFSGAIWLNAELFEYTNRDQLAYQLRYALAEQYFALAVHADPLADAWMAVSVCEYTAYLALEEQEGYDAFVRALNGRVADALQVTVPGDQFITASAAAFSQAQFDLVVRDRGAAVMHETRVAMGREAFLASLARYYADYQNRTFVAERDLVQAMDDATGGDWEGFVTDMLFHIDEYAEHTLDWYE